jgi:hypothetical protein
MSLVCTSELEATLSWFWNCLVIDLRKMPTFFFQEYNHLDDRYKSVFSFQLDDDS